MILEKYNLGECGNYDLENLFTEWSNDRERIKAISRRYKTASITDAFKGVYGSEIGDIQITKEVAKKINRVVSLEVGHVYSGYVKNIDKHGIEFDVNGVKDEIRCKENFNDCIDNVRNYLLNHNNQLYFEVREISKGKVTVSVINGYYKKWCEAMEDFNMRNIPIDVMIDDLVNGGYVSHCLIEPLCELTGKEYTHSVFIPGSQIILNIETNFEQWIGQVVEIIPQNFVKFRNVGTLVENSLVGSRKKLLQLKGIENLHQLWTTYSLGKKDNVKVTLDDMEGTVTGIINSNKKQGVFLEIADKYFNGFLPTKEFRKYHVGDTVRVKIKDFEVQDGKQAFEYNKKGKIKRCNTRVVFELA